jgi:hypothetical protein
MAGIEHEGKEKRGPILPLQIQEEVNNLGFEYD